MAQQNQQQNSGQFSQNDERTTEAARMGGESKGMDNNAGSFADNPEKARQAGREGGSR
jgi:uncharacterized protein